MSQSPLFILCTFTSLRMESATVIRNSSDVCPEIQPQLPQLRHTLLKRVTCELTQQLVTVNRRGASLRNQCRPVFQFNGIETTQFEFAAW